MENHSQFVNKVLGAPQDISLPILRSLFAKGYRQTMWRTNAAATDAPCISKDGDQQGLSSFISGLQHAAPIYEKTHVGCRCNIEVTGPGKDPVMVSAFGLVTNEEPGPAPDEAPEITPIEPPAPEKPAKGKPKKKEEPGKSATKTEVKKEPEKPKPVPTEAPKAPTLKKVIEQVKKATGMGDQRIKKT